MPQCDGDDCNSNFVAGGWVAAKWNPLVRERFQQLLKALAAQFDRKLYGINLLETSIEVQSKKNITGYTCQGYFEGALDNARYAAQVFKHSYTVQYVNFWPCDWVNENNYLSDSFQFFADHGVGLSGLDNIFYKETMENNAYLSMSK